MGTPDANCSMFIRANRLIFDLTWQVKSRTEGIKQLTAKLKVATEKARVGLESFPLSFITLLKIKNVRK